jgi:3-oxoacyl-[acyl-carrier protein] reductase
MIVVTGASRGLGGAIVSRLTGRGEHVVGLARNTEGLPFPSIACDVSSHAEVRAAAKDLKKMGQVSALINAAGIASMNLAVTTPPDVARRIINTNLLGTIYCCQLISPLMLRQRQGRIINFSTIAVALGLKGESIYVASKAGVEGFTRAFAREMSDFNITVNGIAPGPIKTDLLRGVTDAQISTIVNEQIIRREFSAEDVCDLVELLLNRKSDSLSGQIFHVGGV